LSSLVLSSESWVGLRGTFCSPGCTRFGKIADIVRGSGWRRLDLAQVTATRACKPDEPDEAWIVDLQRHRLLVYQAPSSFAIRREHT